ncbi:glycosyltransferase family 2 protein [Riemerella anatipestifer]|nr:glycosyltransferase family 2 protein [Riemerella anatipestifer]
MTQPSVSILMCNYNNAQYIAQAIESVLSQSYNNWELSILDDCSTDNSMEIIDDYSKKDCRIKVFRNEVNMGYGKSMAKNIENSSGKYGAILDPDDALEPHALEIMIENITKSDSLVGAYSQMYYCDSNLRPRKVFEYSRAIPKGQSYLEYGKMAMTHFFLFDRQKFLSYGNVDTSFRNALDQDWYYKIEEIGEVVFVPEPLYFYRVSPTGLSQGIYKKYYTQLDHFKIKQKAIKRRGIKDPKVIAKILKSSVLEIHFSKYRILKSENSPLAILFYFRWLYKKIMYKIRKI